MRWDRAHWFGIDRKRACVPVDIDSWQDHAHWFGIDTVYELVSLFSLIADKIVPIGLTLIIVYELVSLLTLIADKIVSIDLTLIIVYELVSLLTLIADEFYLDWYRSGSSFMSTAFTTLRKKALVSDEKLGVFNDNLGVPDKKLGVSEEKTWVHQWKSGSPMKSMGSLMICLGSPMKIWGSQMERLWRPSMKGISVSTKMIIFYPPPPEFFYKEFGHVYFKILRNWTGRGGWKVLKEC